ncbi:glycosyltransferase family 2 protein [Nocardioides sp. GY 10127]|uniref:glycosyltransferase family 2 protein n=1 Tax=Nocardioides sp. GY 10127 TaxID=2569762 RepID=UPI0010A85B78|nr:glycosyltransferase family 2 protein [Nocardioides sp. GY 10127]TIC86553.1 glycosyltransferase family 2 protein [Nocardioides sp. GY 10127]
MTAHARPGSSRDAYRTSGQARSSFSRAASRPSVPSVSVVVPALNEARNLEAVLPELREADERIAEVVLIDGGSVDDTVEVAQRLLPTVRVVRQGRRGKGNALAAGFAAARGDVIVMFDADGSADPSEITAFVDALTEGADFAKGTRYGWDAGSADITAVRSTGNHGLNLAMNTAFGTRFSDLCYGYNAFWADQLPVLDLPESQQPSPDGTMLWGDGFEIETVIACRFAAADSAITEVPSVERLRLHGASNLHAVRDGIRVLRTIATERVRAGRGMGGGAGRRERPGRHLPRLREAGRVAS